MLHMARAIAEIPDVGTSHEIQNTPNRFARHAEQIVFSFQARQFFESLVRIIQVLEYLAADDKIWRRRFRLHVVDAAIEEPNTIACNSVSRVIQQCVRDVVAFQRRLGAVEQQFGDVPLAAADFNNA